MIMVSERMCEFEVTIGDSLSAQGNPVIYSRGHVPEARSGSVTITQGSPWYGSVVGVYRKVFSGDRYAISLCEVVIIGTNTVCVYMNYIVEQVSSMISGMIFSY